ncbi:hypothetical protein Tc00.1047053509911.20 [Trypanosoma cruzi]|uniref:Uncharacterized protein n=1 Tax=Trypanosoma cruzi (strain CL Brener) TaxID=353153 RepID=Q4DFQ5_TRYCC|nr:hypothetical protein Tc00.1047053509911.20 [Trypanosoma cruzi]EAN91346.1 hypothetical protein Tc00.1047053509911.20 [Trypanosoma cruzi]|eukprot:XP_813197.1 hypothetical protein [Trypanosoma cruzi strain CL Brener]
MCILLSYSPLYVYLSLSVRLCVFFGMASRRPWWLFAPSFGRCFVLIPFFPAPLLCCFMCGCFRSEVSWRGRVFLACKRLYCSLLAVVLLLELPRRRILLRCPQRLTSVCRIKLSGDFLRRIGMLPFYCCLSPLPFWCWECGLLFTYILPNRGS